MIKKDDKKTVELKVGELTQREEFGRGIVRIDSKSMQKIGIKEGDVIELEGTRKSAGIAVHAYPSDAGLSIARMDGLVRRNIGTGVGDSVKIKKADVKEAKKIVIAPAQKGVIIQISPNIIKNNMYYRPLSKGDIIVPSPVVKKKRNDMDNFWGIDIDSIFESMAGFTPTGEMRFIVTNTEPKGIVQITEMTEIEVLKELPKGLDLKRKSVPSVTYEDVGGIHQAIHKVREMIELPLRHPELFEKIGIEPPKGVLLYGPPGTGKTLLARAVANESGANFYTIAGPECMSMWYGKSLPPSENVFIENNGNFQRIPIGKLVEEQIPANVISFDQNGKIKYSKIKDFIKHPNNGKILEIKTGTGRKISVTDYHSLFSIQNGEIKDMKTSELIPEQSYIAIPKIIPSISNKKNEKIDLIDILRNNNVTVRNHRKYLIKAIEKLGIKKVAKTLDVKEKYVYDLKNKEIAIKLIDFIKLMKIAEVDYDENKILISSHHKRGSIPAVIKLDEDLCRLFGLWTAEGDYNKNSIRISNCNKYVKDDINKVCKKLGLRCSIFKDCVFINSKPLQELFKKIGLVDKAKNKHIPDFIFSLKKTLIGAFLKGYFTGDGSIYKNQRGVYTIEACTVSEKLANDLLHSLLYFGIVGKIIEKDIKNGKKYRVYFAGAKNFRNFKEIGFLDKERDKKIKKYINSIKWERSYQIPMFNELREFLEENNIKESISSNSIGEERLSKLLKKHDKNKKYPKLWKIIENEIYWDRVEFIKEIEQQPKYVYDISVNPTENFLSGTGIFAHNSEENLRKIFEEAEKNAPSIIFIDEIDSIAPKREETKGEVERRVVSQLLTLMDGLKSRGKVIVIAATNRENALDPALRRPGRFDREIEIGVPDKKGRKEILQIHSRDMPLTKNVNLEKLSEITYGYVGADLEALCKEAAMLALRRILPRIKWKEEEELPQEVLEKLKVSEKDFENALKMVEPSAMREVLVEVPNVHWDDVGGLNDVKQKLKESIEWPLKDPDSFERLGIDPPKGVLLYGPPGCGKTLLARAVATESGANFISVKGPQLLSMWVGESERKIRELFRRAKQVSPSIIFFDEIDALIPSRGTSKGDDVSERIVSQVLTELSGLEDLHDVIVIAATNRPDILDAALLRPGRVDRQILIPEPDEKARLKILQIKTKKMPLQNVKLEKLAKETESYSGADLEALCREAAIIALRENKKSDKVKMKHFEQAIKLISPSLDGKIIDFYKKFSERYHNKVMKASCETEPGYVG